MPKRKVLVVTDFMVTTGFATVAHALLTRQSQETQTFYILGINTNGDPHPLREQFPHTYPASVSRDHDSYGVARYADLVAEIKPDLIVIQQDAWNLPFYSQMLERRGIPAPRTIAYCPPDALNQGFGAKLTAHGIDYLLTPTQFGIDALRAGGYLGPGEVLPYGVDTARFHPMDRRETRKAIFYPENMWDGFVVGRADRNAPRKRYDLTLEGFAEWWHGAGKPEDGWLFCHCAIKAPIGWDLLQLADYYDISGRLRYTAPDLVEGRGVSASLMPKLYNSWDLHLAQANEGFGLVALESAACGVAQAYLDYAAYGEWLKGAGIPLRPGPTYVTPGGPNTIGKAPRPSDIAEAIQSVYEDRGKRDALGQAALTRATDPTYDWDRIANRFAEICDEVLERPKVTV